METEEEIISLWYKDWVIVNGNNPDKFKKIIQGIFYNTDLIYFEETKLWQFI